MIASAPAAITAAEGLALAVVAATALGVYAVPNTASQAEVEAALHAFEQVRQNAVSNSPVGVDPEDEGA